MRFLLPLLLLTCTGVLAQEPASSKNSELEIENAQVSLIQNTFIAAPIPGVIAKVLVSEGDRVQAGHPLVQLDSEQAETELEAARAAYEALRLESDNDVDARYAKRTLAVREQELLQSVSANRQFPGSVSDTEIAKLQLVVDQSSLAIEQAEHDLMVAKANANEKLAAAKIVEARLRKHGVQSTVNGMVIEIDVEAGEWVEAGKPIVRVVSLNPMRIECFVDGRKHGSELTGRRVEFFPAGDAKSNKPLQGKVTFVSPELQAVTGQARLWATIENPDLSARAGMRGRLVIGSN
ncbi:MAG: efflux RND transporter periplasmic adaptor subunit [Rubripirellula sp.]